MRGAWRRTIEGEHRVGLASLLYALLGGPVAWSLHLLISYFLVALACTSGWEGAGTALALVTLIFAAAALGAGVVGYRNWRRFYDQRPWDVALAEPGERSAFLLVVGMILSGLFFAIIVLAGLPPLYVPTCPVTAG